MQTVARNNFTTVKTEGAILPADLLQRVASQKMEGLQPTDYHLAPGEKLGEAISRAWTRCQGVWETFNEQRQLLPDSDSGTSLTRERWLLILFQELGYGRLPFQQRGLELPEDPSSISNHHSSSPVRYPISHLWQQTPIHLVGFRQDLDRRDPSIKRSPHSLMQEFLNRSDDYLWGFISNGLTLQILRDNISLTRAAYVEFDLEKMMTEHVYADFSLLWLICHQSRVETLHGTSLPTDCWLEKWSQQAVEQGTRALDALSSGVQDATTALGRGFLAHPGSENERLKQKLRTGALSRHDYFRQLLRLVYRLIFLFVAEDRDLLLLPEADEQARTRYTTYYAAGRLRRLAEARRGGPHPDLYRALRRVFFLLRAGYPDLALPALGSFLFSERSTPTLDECDIANADLLNAIRALAFTVEGQVTRPVDYKNLGAEELGSVYESLLELHPFLNIEAASFTLELAAGSERKTTGSYYTPTSLITSLLDSALEPVVADRLRAVRSGGFSRPTAEGAPTNLEQAILDIKVVDPACGSGHFLIAAANRLAAHLARVRTGDDEPSPTARREALRDVVHHCIHGVDINEMAVELCKVGLWMETINPGNPLGFLERNIQCGNSLIGATPALLRQGIPDDAFKPITGDDKAYCQEWKARNKEERKGQLSMRFGEEPWERLDDLAAAMAELDSMGDRTLAEVRAQEAAYARMVLSNDYEDSHLWADTWCAAFVWKKTTEFPYPITEQTFRKIGRNPFDVAAWMKAEIKRLYKEYQFFHWHLVFPHVFHPQVAKTNQPDEPSERKDVTGWTGGFDVVLGNPPWERIKLQEKEWFASRDEAIATAPNAAARRKLITQLPKTNPALHEAFAADKRKAEGESTFVRDSGKYPLCGRGDVNTYTLFAELARHVQSDTGRVGVIVPSGIASDDTTKYYFQDIMESAALVSLYDFENRAGLFPTVDSRMKFCLLTLTGTARPSEEGARFIFFALDVADLREDERRFTLSAADITLLNPNTRTCPIFRSQRDAELTKAIYRRVPAHIIESDTKRNAWGIYYLRIIDFSDHAAQLRSKEQLLADNLDCKDNEYKDQKTEEHYLPLYEAKLINYFDHRYASFENVSQEEAYKGNARELKQLEHDQPNKYIYPRYWVSKHFFESIIEKYKHDRNWLLGFRDVTNNTNERTFIASVIPRVPATRKFPTIGVEKWKYIAGLTSNFSTHIADYVARQKIGGTSMSFYVFKQLPFLPPNSYKKPCSWDPSTNYSFLLPRVLELAYTAYDLLPFAQDCGYTGAPFRWDEARRFLLRCELDAAYFHLYGIERDDVDYIMDTFPIVKRKDEAAHGDYRTKRLILEIYDEMAEAAHTGQPYQTRLDPPPADPRATHTWDEVYLGPYRDPSTWWQEVEAVPVEKAVEEKQAVTYQLQAKSPHSVKESTQPFHLTSSPPTSKETDKITPAPAHASQQPLLAVMPAPGGPRSRRLKQAMALGKESSPTATRELVAFLADEDSSIRWLAGSSLVQRANSDVVAAIAAFLEGAEPERVTIAKPEIQRVLGLIAETAENEAVQNSAKTRLAQLDS